MPIFQTNLLIRDNRLEQFEQQGCKVQWHTLSDEDLSNQLRGKLMEEATEAALAADAGDMLKEFADLAEVMDTLATLNGLSFHDILEAKAKRRAALGGFEKRIFSQSINAPEGSETAAYHRQYPDKYPELPTEN
jgi:predicted house-cleaning noncanonical NTP pyrophosphatase (MazG superfamily)